MFKGNRFVISETYAQARMRLLAAFAASGWKTKADLKVPYAMRDNTRVSFHAQAVYLGAHSLFIDIRGMFFETLIGYINKRATGDHLL